MKVEIDLKTIIKKGLITIFILLLLFSFWLAFISPSPELKTNYQYPDFYQTTDANYLESWPENIGPALNENREKFIQILLDNLTLEEKIAQMIILPNDIAATEFERFQFSGLVFDQGKRKDGGNKLRHWHKSLDSWWTLQQEAADKNKRPFIPPFFKLDTQAGNAMTLSQTIFPSKINLGQANNRDLVEAVAKQQALMAANIGFNWITNGYDSPIHDKRSGHLALSYSEDPKVNADLAASFVKGAQFIQDQHIQVMSDSKGYLAKGAASFERANIFTDEAILLNRYAQGHIAAIKQGVLAIELASGAINSKDLLTSNYYVQQILKDKMGFNGIVSSPINATAQVSGCRLASCITAINAGVDLFYFDSDVAISAGPASYGKKTYDASDKFIESTKSAVESGKVDIKRINDAALRVLRVKHQLGLFEYMLPSQRAQTIEVDQKQIDDINYQAVKQSAVLLKNSKEALPLDNKYKILLTGLGSDELTYQIGNWANSSLRNLNNRSIKKGVSLNKSFKQQNMLYDYVPYEFINSSAITAKALDHFNKRQEKKNIPKKDKKGIYGEIIELDSDKEEKIKEYQQDYEKRIKQQLRYYQQIVMVISQDPVLDGKSKESNLNFSQFYREQLEAFSLLQELDSKIIVILYGHYPMYMPEIMDKANAIIFAGQPGTDASALVDVLMNRDIEKLGALSMSWPRQPCDFKQSFGVELYDPLLKIGYGLNFNEKPSTWKTALPEEEEYCTAVKR